MAYRPSLTSSPCTRAPQPSWSSLSPTKELCSLGTWDLYPCLSSDNPIRRWGSQADVWGYQFTRGTAPHRKGPEVEKTVHFWSCLRREGRWDCKGPLGLSCREDSGERGRAGRLCLKPRLKCSGGQSMRAMEVLMHIHKFSVPFPTRKWS